MRHVDYSDARGFELGDQIEEFRHLRVGQRGGGLVEYQKTDLGEERLRDLYHLLVGARQLLDLAVGVEIEIEFADDGLGTGSHSGAVEESAGGQFASEKQVLFDGQFRHQAEFLEHGTDADGPRAMRSEMADLPSLILEGAGVGRKSAGNDIGQSRLARTVFTEQDVHFAAAKVEVDTVQSDDARKPL